MVNLSNSQMVIICRREWMYSNVARKYLKTNKKFKTGKLREQQDRFNEHK